MAELKTTQDGGVLTITLDRPDVLNALTAAMHAQLADALAEAADPAVRAVVITGAGRGFCVGQDLAELAPHDVGRLLRSSYHPNVLAIRALPKPVIAAVNGPAAGAGLGLACACDLRIASEAAVFVPAFVSIGLAPDAGSTFFIERLLGAPRAFEWLASGRRLTAAEALAWGLVSEVVPEADFTARVTDAAARWAQAPTAAVGRTKQLLDRASTTSLGEQLEREAEAQSALALSEDFREGVAAFREKRDPRFTGR
jgi:2-(1,2-epoxy-1,2-dihydrophenyl)acetyl-CoA isomerase